jgi:hypothetical protein
MKYRAVKAGQMETLKQHFDREKARIALQLTVLGQTHKNSAFTGSFPELLLNIPDAYRDEILIEFDIKSKLKYDEEFTLWRQQMLEIEGKGLKDDRFMWRSPYIAPYNSSRIVYDFDEAGYDPEASWMVKKCAIFSWKLASSISKSA